MRQFYAVRTAFGQRQPWKGRGLARDINRAEDAVEWSERIDSVKHLLWHGNVAEALDRTGDLLLDMDLMRAHSVAAEKLAAGMTEFEIYIRNNREFIPNFGERYRQGERISTAFVESTINQVVSRRFVKKQQMQWSLKGAHLLLQTRTKVLNNELEDVFRRWYPQFRQQSAAAWQAVKVIDRSEDTEEDGTIVQRERERFANELTLVFASGETAILR